MMKNFLFKKTPAVQKPKDDKATKACHTNYSFGVRLALYKGPEETNSLSGFLKAK